MNVQEAIKRLTETYKPDEELFIVWWDKETADGYRYPDSEVTVPQWVSIVEQLDNDEYLFHAVNDTITELANNQEVE
jgi:hypothetical protein